MVVSNVFYFHHYLVKTSNFFRNFSDRLKPPTSLPFIIHDYKGLYPRHSLSSARFTPPVSGGPGPPSISRGQDGSECGHGLLDGGPELGGDEAKRRRSRQDGWMKRDPWRPGYFFRLGIWFLNVFNGMKHGR